jgi:K+-transporting ATPase c subunit
MPEQYFWAHKRFKTRPEGERSPYEKKASGGSREATGNP